MKEFFKGKFVTGIVIIATIILAGVAIFTALRLYNLRKEGFTPTAPGSEPAAWDCSKYVFSIEAGGSVKVTNGSTRNEPAQKARVYINGNLVNTFDVPALNKDQSANLGTVQLPSGNFSWSVVGTLDCQSSGTQGSQTSSCEQLSFNLIQKSPTVTLTITPTLSPSPTEPPIGGTSPTPTVTATPTLPPSPTPTFPPPPSIPEPPQCTAQKPSAPTLTSVVKTGTQAVLTWTSVNLATHYVISYGTSPTNLEYGVPNTGKVTTYTIKSLNANSKYYFTVYAVNDCMPSEGSTIVASVAGSSTEIGELPPAGLSFPTILTLASGFLVIAFALILVL
ncbi:hypothetical protein A2159_00055 [Candidatus Woesebacteria bacterium RBG_13_34_9]|uniref:Fibronectin type-III domain-containing protein n=1 Tax=Candidatus Woesebacteria bacterium RBG_13_34_9 TaxID=1802477 RepID=A0A1F7X369_9BACT|nr:MAG: hypothetical protein A2159_00055 [Candidatus Woesebacteria bacterium RBG_13_34_9]